MPTTSQPEALSEGLLLNRVEFASDGSLHSVARQHGCETSAIAQLIPFVVDDSFITVLTWAGKLVRSAELITAMHAAFVRRPSTQEVLLGFELGRPRHTVYMDEALLDHDELLFCVDPPNGYAIAAPEALRTELGARLISLPGNPAPIWPDVQPVLSDADDDMEPSTP